jgi:uracil phosphoribosyltransferase
MRKVIDNKYANGQKSIIMSSSSTPEILKACIYNTGVEIAKNVIEEYFIKPSKIITPMGIEVTLPIPIFPLCAIITTKDDFEYLGKGISSVINNSIKGYMDFEGIRGTKALNAEIQNMILPDIKGQNVDTLIIAKAVLATGCTAINLAKNAIAKYLPRKIIIASVFYSESGVRELMHNIPNADIFLVGEHDSLNGDGMLVPGVGDLDKRISD